MSKQPEFRIKEQNFSGVSSFYRAKPMRTYVVEVGLKGNVRGELLQEAVNNTLKRMPYFADAFVEKNGDFFYAENPLPMEVKETDVLRRVGGAETNWHCIDVTFWNDTIWFSMFHGLCDGLGMNLFIEATIYHYFRLRDGINEPVEGIRTQDTPILPGEEFDPYSVPYELPEDYAVDFFKDQYWHLPEIDEKPLDHMQGTPVRVKEEDFIRFVKENNSSPVAVLHAMMANAVQKVHPENRQLLGALVPTSNRKALGAENTFKNSAGALRLPYPTEEMEKLSFAEQAQKCRALLKEANDPRLARFLANTMGGALRQVGTAIPNFTGRLSVLDFSKGSNNDTFMIDYVGGLKAGRYASEIVKTKYMATNLDPGFRTVTLYLTATAGYFHLEVVRAFESSVYVDAFLEQLTRCGIHFEREEESRYITPVNGLITDLGLLDEE